MEELCKNIDQYIDDVMVYLRKEYPEIISAVIHKNYPIFIAHNVGRILWSCFSSKESHVTCCGLISQYINSMKHNWMNSSHKK